jgi:hypothetical protein
MNVNLLKILKKITVSHGENILSDPQRLKAVFSDLAKNEPKEDRVAFGRCIEMGFYNEFKKTQTEEERRKLKIPLANQMQAKTGIDKPHCTEALDLLEAVMFKPQQQLPFSLSSGKLKSVSGKTLMFGVAGALGACVGSITGGSIAVNFNGIKHWTIWQTMLAVGISIGFLVSQNTYLRKKFLTKSFVKVALIGGVISVVTGAAAGVIVGAGSGNHLSRTIAWGFTGLGIGLVATLFIRNYPKKRAMAAGTLGGVIGYFVSVLISPYIGGFAGVVLGDMVLGAIIGLTISFIEEALRAAWLTVIWGKNETKTISLGQKPVIFGSSKEADIYLPKDKEPPVRATVQIENSKIVMFDKSTNQRRELQNGDRVDLGKVSFVVNTKK